MNLKTVGVILLISFVVALYMQFTGMGGRTVPHINPIILVVALLILILFGVIILKVRSRS